MLLSLIHISLLNLPNLGSASPAPECTSRADEVMGRSTAPVESAVRWITLPTAPHGPSCRERSPPYWALLQQEQELHQLPHPQLGRDLGRGLGPGPGQGLRLGLELPVELELQVEMSLSRKRERRDDIFHRNQDPTQPQAGPQMLFSCF